VTAHTHTSIVPGCYRCDLSLDEVKSAVMHCSRTNVDGSPCKSIRDRSVPWIKDPWDCGKHRRRGKAIPERDPMDDHLPTEQDLSDLAQMLSDEQAEQESHL
jgi:hypothetical protein